MTCSESLALIARGCHELVQSAQGDSISRYHAEAAIASFHATAQRFEDTDWPRILDQYDLLIRLAPSPVVELNRAVESMAAARIQTRYGPDLPERELRLRLAALRLPRETMIEIFDWDPELKGY